MALALVADSDAHRNAQVSGHLTAHGWQVVSVGDGTAALRELCSRRIGLMVIHVDLPDVAGMEVVASARAAGWQERVIFVDAAERPEVRKKCKDLGALAYLVTPISSQALAASLWRARTGAGERGDDMRGEDEDLLQELTPGTQADVCIRTGAAAGTYVATVTEVGPASLSLLTQGREGATLYIGLGTPVFVGFATRQGWAEFESRVSSSCIRNTFTELALARPQQVMYRQRRRWPRVRAILPIRAWPTSHPDRAGVMVVGQTEDLSKHGLKACFSAPLPETDLVTLALDGGSGIRELRLSGRPIWQQKSAETPTPGHYRYGFEFSHLTPAMRLAVEELLGKIGRHGEGARRGPTQSTHVRAATRTPLKQ